MVAVVRMRALQSQQPQQTGEADQIPDQVVIIAVCKPILSLSGNAAPVVVRPLCGCRTDGCGCEEQSKQHACSHGVLLCRVELVPLANTRQERSLQQTPVYGKANARIDQRSGRPA